MFIVCLVWVLAACGMNNGIGSQEKLVKTSKAMNVLVIGIDTRGEEKSRSDAILIGQYDPKAKSVKVASIMRDTYVKIPGYRKGSHKLNTAYFLGGKELLMQTIEENFGIRTDHVVTVDFQGFTHIVDTMVPEGIEVNVTEEIIEDMGLHLKPGPQSLHGEELLKYVRFRHDSDNDFGRVKRQQEVIVKLKERMQEEFTSVENLLSFPKVVETALQYIDTDLPASTALSLASSLILNQVETIETITIPLPDSYENNSYEHAGAVLQMDKQKNVEALQNFFNYPKEVNN